MIAVSSTNCLEATLIGVEAFGGLGSLLIGVGLHHSPPRNHAVVHEPTPDGALNKLRAPMVLIKHHIIARNPQSPLMFEIGAV